MSLKQKSTLFDENLADECVKVKLKKEFKRRLKMPVIKTSDGKLYRVDEDQEVSIEDVQNEVTDLQAFVEQLQSVLADVTQPALPVEPAVATPETPAEPEAPVVAEVPVEQPVTEVVADQVADPNQVPVETLVDPNAVAPAVPEAITLQ